MKITKILLIIAILALVQWWFRDPLVHIPDSDISFSYLVKYSAEGNGRRVLPMLVALHGNGDTASHFYETALDRITAPARIILLEGPVPYGRGRAWPWTRADFTKYGNAVNRAIEILEQKYPTIGKPVLLGFSGGAMMAYYQAVRHGDSYSYIFPVSGQLDRDWLGEETTRPGAEVLAYHGRNDNLIPVSGGRNAIHLLQAKGIRASLAEFDGGHLGVFTNMKMDISRAVEEKIRALE